MLGVAAKDAALGLGVTGMDFVICQAAPGKFPEILFASSTSGFGMKPLRTCELSRTTDVSPTLACF